MTATQQAGATTHPLVHLDVDGEIATIRLDSQHNRNALSRTLCSELDARLREAINDTAVRIVILTHDGPAFCSGADLREMLDGRDHRANAPTATVVNILESIWTSPKPVLAVLRGPARAGGVGIMAACDIVLAASTVTFAFTEVRIGAIPAVISVPLAVRVREAELHEYFLTGESFPACRAAEIGLVNAVAENTELDSLLRSYTDRILRGAPHALAGAKTLLRPAERLSGPRLAELQQLSLQHFDSDEGAEGIHAFLDKRRPAWVPAPKPRA